MRSSLRTLVVALLLLGASSTAVAANCNVAAVCSAEPFINNPSCCFGLFCQLDGDVALSGPDCVLDFGNRDVTISGKVALGTRRLKIRAKSVVLSNAVDGRGLGTARGGTLEIETFVGTALDVRLLTNAAKIDLSGGGGGGTFSVMAEGGISLEKGEIRADGTSLTASGGTIDLRSQSGNVHVATALSANDGAGTGGGSSRISLLAPGGNVSIAGANMTAEAGSIDVLARDAVTSDQAAKLRTDRGGAIDVAGATLALGGEHSASFGTINFHATSGAVVVNRASQPGLRVDASNEGDVGEISVIADGPGAAGSITIETPIVATGADVELVASGTLRITKRLNASGQSVGTDTTGAGQVMLESEMLDIELTGDVLANDSQSEGSIEVLAGHDVLIGSSVETKGANGGPGGTITILAEHDIQVGMGKTIDASGGMSGGVVELRAGGDVILDTQSKVDASTGQSPAPGGAIDLVAGADGRPGSLLIAGNVVAEARDTQGSPSTISLEGCSIGITPTGMVNSTRLGSTGTSGVNTITARSSMSVVGKLRGGANVLTAVAQPTGGGEVTPAFTVTLRPVCTDDNMPLDCLVPCPTCGDGQIEFPETCDQGATDRCSSGCTPSCRDDLLCGATLPCADIACDPIGGCYFGPLPQGTSCDDGNACTPTDTCAQGICVGSGALDCNDGNPCNGTETCAPGSGCQAGTPLACNDGNACTTDACAPATGCQFTPNAEPCDDGNVCTVADTCGNGSCQPGVPRTCDPGEICVVPGGCQAAPFCENAEDCDDGNACNGTETCVNDACVAGTPVVCNDGDICNGGDTCNPSTGACEGAPLACDDGNACNGVETCSPATGCQPGTPLVCGDGDVCTTDTCDPVQGCQNTEVPGCCTTVADCVPADVCDDAACVANVCVYETSALCCEVPADCDDENPCTTDDVCNAQQRCEHTPLDGTQPGCGDACATGLCSAGACVTGEPIVCDDETACTDDSCDPATGCVFTPVEGCCESDAACDDGNPCSTDTCDLDVRACINVVDELCNTCVTDGDCDPLGACNGARCIEGVCTAVTPLTCDDGNRCTIDTCPDAGGCDFTLVSCDDGLACNGAESCSPLDGCRPGTVPNCDDGDLCTDDACVEPAGCTHVRRTSFAGVVCQLDMLSAALDRAATEQITAKLRRKVAKLANRVRATLRAAEGASSPRKRAKLTARAGKQLRALGRTIERERDRGIAGELADVLRRSVDGATASVGTLG